MQKSYVITVNIRDGSYNHRRREMSGAYLVDDIPQEIKLILEEHGGHEIGPDPFNSNMSSIKHTKWKKIILWLESNGIGIDKKPFDSITTNFHCMGIYCFRILW